ncbi:hypothetical protein RR48_08528 [Papilio machaon]|uniref:Uncharacterized protein n=1 Tax=Papilio machaon TaxID=76193 RepID=A0A194RIF4_PAPMA|nr:hypothetical protein RR48_08528 [Papilio machaon]
MFYTEILMSETNESARPTSSKTIIQNESPSTQWPFQTSHQVPKIKVGPDLRSARKYRHHVNKLKPPIPQLSPQLTPRTHLQTTLELSPNKPPFLPPMLTFPMTHANQPNITSDVEIKNFLLNTALQNVLTGSLNQLTQRKPYTKPNDVAKKPCIDTEFVNNNNEEGHGRKRLHKCDVAGCHKVCEHCSEPIGTGEKVVCEGYSYHKQCRKCSNLYVQKNVPNAYWPVVTLMDRKTAGSFATLLQKMHQRQKGFNESTIGSKPIPLHPGSEIKYLRMKMSSEHTTIIKKCEPDIKKSIEIKQLYKDSPRSTMTNDQKLAPSRLPPKYTKYRKPSINHLSDMRIAELGTSTEIANTALRKKSEEEAVIIKSITWTVILNNVDPSGLIDDESKSYIFYVQRWRWVGRGWATTQSARQNGVTHNPVNPPPQRHDQSGDGDDSLSSELDYSVSMKSDKKHWMDRRIRSIMKIPYTSCNCKHLKTSHSYRCMRAHVMRTAGPTKSQLAGFRAKLLRMVVPSPKPNMRCKSKNITPSCPIVVDSTVL